MVEMPVLVSGTYPSRSGYDADIIILTRNRLLETIEAVDSALRQKGSRFHISVLDQGSDANIQSEFLKAFDNHKNFGYFTVRENLGVGGGRNFLSSIGFGSVIIALDNDAVFADDFVVEQALKSFDEKAELGVLAFKILARDGKQLDEYSWGYPASTKRWSADLFDTTTFVGAGHAIRRSTWEAADGYDPYLFFTWEEYDFCLRAIALGWVITYDGSLAVIHKVSPEGRVRWSSERMEFSVRNRLIIARKWKVSWFSLLPRLFGYLLRAARHKSLNPTFLGIFAAIGEDRALIKASTNLRMDNYVKVNETQLHGNIYESFRNRVIVKVEPEI
jgi:GT2 family glycosyltransferase